MDVDKPEYEHPDLEPFRRVRIAEMEEERFRRLTGTQQRQQAREVSEASTSTLRPLSMSGDSTPTMSEASEGLHDRMDIDTPQTAASDSILSRENQEAPIIVATDFGTTFSAVAFARREKHPRIDMIINYPDDPRSDMGRLNLEVPTESWYPRAGQIEDSPFDDSRSGSDDEPSDDIYDASDQEDNQVLPDDSVDGDAMMETEQLPAINENRTFFWGYGIQSLTTPDMDRNEFNCLSRFKLLLDTTERTQKVRDGLRPVLKRLRDLKTIKNDEDVIADYLTQLFLHTKAQLITHHGISESTSIEHVLTIPVVWKSKETRIMQRAVEAAIKKSGFGTIDSLFLVSEPEAAATYAVSKGLKVNANEAFLILDAGGGTVDATTYMMDKEHPLRLSKELVEPDGRLNGSSFLNQDFRDHLFGRLEKETYLEQHGFTIRGIVDTEAIKFENKTKRNLDITERALTEKIIVQGLHEDPAKRFGKNRVFVNRSDFEEIFNPHLNEIESLVRRQLTDARDSGFRVQKVVLMGGFSGSPSLRGHLNRALRHISKDFGYNIRLLDAVHSNAPETAVAHGAVLRALNKDHGPERITNSSYGFLRAEPYDPAFCPAHVGVRPTIDKLDGERYVCNTIEWLVKKGQRLPTHAEYPIPVYHLFSAKRKTFKCEEVLYVSDTSTESHYRRNHEKNKRGSEIAGKIIADMTFLVTEGHIQPIEPVKGYIGKRHYKIEFELVMIIDGRNLRYEARWPAGGKVQSKGQISIAAAFRPGTN